MHFMYTLLSVYLLVSVIFDFMLVRFYVAVIVCFRPSFISCFSCFLILFFKIFFGILGFYTFLSAVFTVLW